MGKGSLRLDMDNPDHRKLLKSRGIDVGSLQKEKPSETRGLPKGERRIDVPEPGELKYKNKKVFAFGRWFDSTWEMECYVVLLSMEQEGMITDLKTQVHYDFVVEKIKIYGANLDFQFNLNLPKPILVVADAKSRPVAKTVKWRMQVRLMKALYQRDILVFFKKETNVKKVLLDLFRSMVEYQSTNDIDGQRK